PHSPSSTHLRPLSSLFSLSGAPPLPPSFPTRRSSDLDPARGRDVVLLDQDRVVEARAVVRAAAGAHRGLLQRAQPRRRHEPPHGDRKSTRLNSSHVKISYAVFCLKKKKKKKTKKQKRK